MNSIKKFTKGTSGNPAGRPVGTPNKITTRIRETIHAALDEASPNVAEWLQQLGKDDPKAALQVYAALSEFVLPKLSRTEAKVEGFNTIMPPQIILNHKK